MANHISTGPVHHLTLTVTDVARATDFYSRLLGFQVAIDLDPRVILSNGGVLLVLTPPPDPAQAVHDDVFNENRVGLDHFSLKVDDHAALEDAVRVLDENSISRGDIKDLGPDLGLYVLAFRDPDNIQVELTAPYG